MLLKQWLPDCAEVDSVTVEAHKSRFLPWLSLNLLRSLCPGGFRKEISLEVFNLDD